MQSTVKNVAWPQRPLWKYGMLVFAVLLFVQPIWDITHNGAEGRVRAQSGLLVAGMLLVNHLMAYFVPLERQRVLRIPQFLFIGLGLLYVLPETYIVFTR